MNRFVRRVAVFVLLALALLYGCQGAQPAKRPVADFRVIQLAEAPSDVAVFYGQMKSVPGLYVLSRDNETYLLIVGGKAAQPGMQVNVVDVQKAFGGPKDVRILATLRPGSGSETYPFAVIQMSGAGDYAYKARLSTETGEVIELAGTPISTR